MKSSYILYNKGFVKSSQNQICQSSWLVHKLIILTNDCKHEIAGNVRRMRFSHALSWIVRSRAIRQRIIRRQVRCGSQQLGKLEGVVFYFRNVQRVSASWASLPFALCVVDSFLRPYSLQQSLPAPFQGSFVNATESETRRQMTRTGITPCRLFVLFFFTCFRLWTSDDITCVTYVMYNLIHMFKMQNFAILWLKW